MNSPEADKPDSDKAFTGSIPKIYETYLVPLIFQPYAVDLVTRLASRSLSRVLEVAAGTGVVTRQMAVVLPANVTITATDLNQPMLDWAGSIEMTRPVQWLQADAMQLPFEDGEFDAVVCQFGVMFFPEKQKAFAEARRVLKKGGLLIFNVWDRLEENEFPHAVSRALDAFFPENPSRFMERTPHGYHDLATVERDLKLAGFIAPAQISTLAARSQASSARIPAIAFCQGTPLRNEIETRGPSRLAEATEFVTQALTEQFGTGAVDGKIQAHIVSIER
jgi:SAM-dependent methyltransferase